MRGRVAALDRLDYDPGRTGGVARRAGLIGPHEAVHGADGLVVVAGDVVDGHRRARPVGPEAARLDRHDLDAERFGLDAEHTAEAVDRELGGLVAGDARRAS